MRTMITVAATLSCLLLASCAGGQSSSSVTPGWPQTRQAFSCPAAGTNIRIARIDGTSATQHWQGADPGDPEMCIVRVGNGHAARLERRLFGIIAIERFGTTEEAASMRSELRALLDGHQDTAKFIWRADNQQTVQFWQLVGTETRDIGGNPVKIVHIHISLIRGSDTKPMARELWFEPASNVFVGQEYSLDYPAGLRGRGYWAVGISTAGATAPAT